MDDIDHHLLRLLRDDARAPLSALAEHLGVSRGTVRNRIERLQAIGVIERFTVDVSDGAFRDQVKAFTLIKLHAKDNRRALGVLRGMIGVSSIHTLSGTFDLGVELAAENLQALDALLDEIRSLSDVADTQSHIRLADVTHPDR